MIKILNVVGARPNFMKMAPIIADIKRRAGRMSQSLIHTGQHYDETMSLAFFRDLDLPLPDVDLGVGSGTHAEQTARVMLAFEPVLLEQRPDWVVVVGDVNSTLACALVASKLGIRVAHVEAGLRSFDRTMPEEINRVLTDQIADLLLTPSRDADANLLCEGIRPERIVRVGNVMIDTLFRSLEAAKKSDILEVLNLQPRQFAVLTLHRPANVDAAATLRGIFSALGEIASRLPIVFPAHPRTQLRLREFGIEQPRGLMILEPMGYLDFLHLWSNARLVMTDSGGLQEETTALAVQCLTLRDNTERPITVEQGTNKVTGRDPARIIEAATEVLRDSRPAQTRVPELWDGRAAERIVEALLNADLEERAGERESGRAGELTESS
ncbi:MAG: UDP-N-acetylglucosamine 2-epimerase (non-hydrolyzing) [Acidobacteria bacterium]|nr:UDP-N-acetylglucosamine 2-epimerase (non-hydrolyzing) [Acidobacteriota bacterium]